MQPYVRNLLVCPASLSHRSAFVNLLESGVVVADSFPTTLHDLLVHVVLSEVSMPAVISVEVVDGDGAGLGDGSGAHDNTPLAFSSTRALLPFTPSFQSRVAVTLFVEPIEFAEPTTCSLRVYADGELVAEQALRIVSAAPLRVYANNVSVLDPMERTS